MVLLVVSLIQVVIVHHRVVEWYTYYLSVTVAGTSTGLTATRLNTGQSDVQISWSSVSEVAGYEVYYQLISGSSSVMSAGTTTNTMLDITSGLSYGD